MLDLWRNCGFITFRGLEFRTFCQDSTAESDGETIRTVKDDLVEVVGDTRLFQIPMITCVRSVQDRAIVSGSIAIAGIRKIDAVQCCGCFTLRDEPPEPAAAGGCKDRPVSTDRPALLRAREYDRIYARVRFVQDRRLFPSKAPVLRKNNRTAGADNSSICT